MARSNFGIDLGTYDIKVYDARNGTVRKVKNAIAIRNKRHVFAIGDDAYEMYEKSPANIVITFPMDGGVISDFDMMQYLLQQLLLGDRRSVISGTDYLLAVPTDVTKVEKRAFFDLVMNSEAKAREVHIVERAVADAIGIGLDVFSPNGIYIINIGGATTEYSVVSSGGIVINRMEKQGGRNLDQAITSFVRKEYNLKIGVFASEELKNNLGSAYGIEESSLLVPGSSLISGLPGEAQVTSHEVYTAVKPAIDRIVANAISMLERIPPEMASNVRREGLYLTGGVANLRNIGKLLEMQLGIPVHTADSPEYSIVNGLKKIMSDPEYSKVAYSMVDTKYRWM